MARRMTSGRRIARRRKAPGPGVVGGEVYQVECVRGNMQEADIADGHVDDVGRD